MDGLFLKMLYLSTWLWHHSVLPRRARIDAAGALHHIICRGIERRRIYRGDSDRQDFVIRLGRILSETRTLCYAWALMPNYNALKIDRF
jgi:hypothetical protein